MLKVLSIVLALSLLGDIAVDALRLPVPGAAVGLLLLTSLFLLHGGPDDSASKLFDTVSPVFPLFFVPAAVGIVANLAILAGAWFYLLVAIAGSTAVTIAVTGLIAQLLLSMRTGHLKEPEK